MHHLTVTLDIELVGDAHRADRSHAAEIVAAEVEQHQMLRPLFRIGKELLLERLVFVRGCAARPGAGDRPDGDGAVAHADQDLGARARDGEAAVVEIIEERCRVHPAQRAVERKRRQRKRRLETLREHDLEDVAGENVIFGASNHRLEFFRRRVRFRRDMELAAVIIRGLLVERLVEIVDHGGEAVDCSRKRELCRSAGLGPNGSDDRQRVLESVEYHDETRADQDAIGNADRVRPGRRQLLQEPHDVVAEITEQAGRHRGQSLRKLDPAFREQGAQRGKWPLAAWHKSLGIRSRRPVDLGPGPVHPPDQVRIET